MIESKRVLRMALLAGVSAFGLAGATAFAQGAAPAAPACGGEGQPACPPTTEAPAAETPATPAAPEQPAAAADGGSNEEVVVTGSRIPRNTFTSVAPLQVIDGEISREIGLTDSAEIIQQVDVAAGTQIDRTVSANFVTDSGPGASSISLRGLDDSRTLVLINGRRLAPAGVEGAPVAADLNLIPSDLIERVEFLLDGASSVYGSDAVAGVVNVIMRKDLEGFEATAFHEITPEANHAGETIGISATYGHKSDKGFIAAALEFQATESLKFRDRLDYARCPDGRNREFDPVTGEEFNIDPRWGTDCFLFGTVNARGLVLGFSQVWWYTPGTTNVGVANWTRQIRTANVDPVNIGNALYQRPIEQAAGDMVPEQERLNFFLNGEYDIGSESSTKFFFEASYSMRELYIERSLSPLFFTAPATYPTNPIGGFGLAWDDLVLYVPGDRNTNDVQVEQMRLVAGLTGDLGLESIGLDNWTWEVSGVYTRSWGESLRQGVREDRLDLILSSSAQTAPGVFQCGQAVNPALPACTFINFFSDQVLRFGTLTDAQRAYLFDNRTFDTVYQQVLLNAFVSGDLFELPGGPASMALGLEYRNDDMDSIPDDVARNGLLALFFADGGATGSAYLMEAFGEVELPLLSEAPLAHELTINVAGRYTYQEFYGSAFTYSAKLLYSPVEWLSFRGTIGTSYRAPNIREFFLAGQSGFAGYSDPCLVPTAAIVPSPIPGGPNTYNAAADNRAANVLANCNALGVNPTTLGLNTARPGSMEVVAGGSRTLDEETSEAFSMGFTVKQPWIEDLTLRFGVNYYEIEVQNSIEEPTATAILNDCYRNFATPGPFCARVFRDPQNFIGLIDAGFINVGLLTSRGIDYNMFYSQDVTFWDETIGLSLDVSVAQLLQAERVLFGNVDENLGELGFPEFRATATGGITVNDFRFLWRGRYIGYQQNDLNVAAFDTCPLAGPNGGGRSAACTTTRLAKSWARTQWLHSASLTWSPETWSVTVGVENIFDTEPEYVDPDVPATANNVGAILGTGYDTLGRRFFISVGKTF